MQSSTFIKNIIVVLAALLTLNCSKTEPIIQSIKDIHYNKHGQQLDLYLPKKRTKRTAIMFIHGGSFKAGDKAEMADFAKQYAQNGFVASSINYRLIPEHRYPTHVNDVTDALSWMQNNASDYGYDADKIVVVGYSAGGTLALNLGLDHSKKVAATVSVAPITDIAPLLNSGPSEILSADLTTYMNGMDPEKASPIAQVNQKPSPVLLLHGDKDEVVPISQSTLLTSKLKEHNVPVKVRVFHDAGHEIMLPNKHLKQLLEGMAAFILTIETKSWQPQLIFNHDFLPLCWHFRVFQIQVF